MGLIVSQGVYFMAIPCQFNTIPVTLSTSSDGLSSVIDTLAYGSFGIEMPSTWDAADITFRACATESGTFGNLYDDLGNEVTVISPGSAERVSLKNIAVQLKPWRYIQIRSGTAATPVAQSTDRAFNLVCR